MGQPEFHAQSTIGHIRGTRVPAVKLHDPARDRQTQTCSFRAVAALKRLEDPVGVGGLQTRAFVPNFYSDSVTRALQPNHHLRALRRMAQGVAQHILDGAPELRAIASNVARIVGYEPNGNAAIICLDLRILDDFLEQLPEFDLVVRKLSLIHI